MPTDLSPSELAFFQRSGVCDLEGFPYFMDKEFYARVPVLMHPQKYPPFARRVAKLGGTYSFTEKLLTRYLRFYKLTFVYNEDWEDFLDKKCPLNRRPWRLLSRPRERAVSKWVTMRRNQKFTTYESEHPTIVNGKFIYLDREQARVVYLLNSTAAAYASLPLRI